MAEATTNTAKAAAETAEQAAEAYKASAKETFETYELTIPENFRTAAETVVNQSREAYERSKDAMEGTVEMLEQSIDKAGQGSAAISRKVIDIFQSNLNSGFEFAKEIAGAKNVAEILECQSAFARKQFETFTAQAEEMRELSTKVATDAAEPFKAHVTRSMENLKVH